MEEIEDQKGGLGTGKVEEVGKRGGVTDRRVMQRGREWRIGA